MKKIFQLIENHPMEFGMVVSIVTGYGYCAYQFYKWLQLQHNF